MSLGNAIGYLTAVKVPARRQVPLAFSLHYFPWIGAAVGSLSILVFLVTNRFLPGALSCAVAVLFPQLLAGWDPWRGLVERIQGHRTFPGHGFRPGFHFDVRALATMGIVFLVKWLALVSLSLDWQTRAVFIFPILGYCARTASFLIAPVKGAPASPMPSRTRVRAGFLSGFLLFLAFQFPMYVAIPILVIGASAVWALVRRENRLAHGLTLQTASCASELAEVITLVSLAVAAAFH